jgi:hypothetical protein
VEQFAAELGGVVDVEVWAIVEVVWVHGGAIVGRGVGDREALSVTRGSLSVRRFVSGWGNPQISRWRRLGCTAEVQRAQRVLGLGNLTPWPRLRRGGEGERGVDSVRSVGG